MDKITYGTYKLTDDTCYNLVLEAIKNGYRSIDTAELYKNQHIVGRAINDLIAQKIIKRKDIFITSKIHNRDQKKNNIGNAVDKILKDMNLEYIDLILLHSPVKNKYVDSYKELIKSKNNNHIKYIGVSNFNIEQLQEIIKETGEIPYLNQVEISVFNQRFDVINFCKKHNIICQAHSCLTNNTKIQDNKIISIQKELHMTFHEICMKWCLDNNIYIVVGAQNKDHVIENLNYVVNYKNNMINDFADLDEKYCIYKNFK